MTKYRQAIKYLCIIAIIFLSFLTVRKFMTSYVMRAVKVKGISMVPTFQDGDTLFISCLSKTPDRGDIIVCGETNVESGYVIKRCIGLPNDNVVIDYDNDTVSVNGQTLDEPYLCEKEMYTDLGVISYTVPEDCYFVLGDNRNVSIDSRTEDIGYIPADDVLGKVWFNKTARQWV